VNGTPALWSLPMSQQVNAVVMQHYGAKLLEEARLQGRVEHEKELERQRDAQETQEREAASKPTIYAMPDGSPIPSIPEISKMLDDPAQQAQAEVYLKQLDEAMKEAG